MTPLERLGLEVAAFTLLGSRSQAAALCALLDAEGRYLDWDQIAAARPWRFSGNEPTEGALKTRISLLRDSLSDVGLDDVVVNAGRREGARYAIPEPARSAVIARLVDEAGKPVSGAVAVGLRRNVYSSPVWTDEPAAGADFTAVALRAGEASGCSTKTTATAVVTLEAARRALRKGELDWPMWRRLAALTPGKKAREAVAGVVTIAGRLLEHLSLIHI